MEDDSASPRNIDPSVAAMGNDPDRFEVQILSPQTCPQCVILFWQVGKSIFVFPTIKSEENSNLTLISWVQ